MTPRSNSAQLHGVNLTSHESIGVLAQLLYTDEADHATSEGGHTLWQAHPFEQRHQGQGDEATKGALQERLSPGATVIHHPEDGDRDGQASGTQLRLIEKHNISLHCPQSVGDVRAAWITGGGTDIAQAGDSALQAACRTIVAAKVGLLVQVLIGDFAR